MVENSLEITMGRDVVDQNENKSPATDFVTNPTGRHPKHRDSMDPFSPREGKEIIWKNVNMTVGGNKKKEGRQLLTNVWGCVPKREMTAIMGPSGAGKTSLLNILAGRIRSGGSVTVSSHVRLNKYVVDPTKINVRKQIAFVTQDDSLFVTSTPRECIRFSAKLRLPRDTTNEEIESLTSRILEELDLTSCADSCVGGGLMTGLSGGERRRTSVGVELVVKPAVVFLDEPTSGLDSFAAEQLVNVLKKVANAGSAVLLTIHQPSSDVFSSFDHLILLHSGRIMYEGSVDVVPSVFAERGFPLPANFNPADWIMKIAKRIPEAELKAAGFFPEDTYSLGKPKAITGTVERVGDSTRCLVDEHSGSGKYHAVFTIEFALQFKREMLNMIRNKRLSAVRLLNATFMGLMVGCVFLGAGSRSKDDIMNFQGHFGALVMTLTMSMFGTAIPTLLTFPEERPVFIREYSTNHYNVVSYFLSRLGREALLTFLQIFVMTTIIYVMVQLQSMYIKLVFIVYTLAMASTAAAVMVGCMVEDPKLAQQCLPIVFIPQLMFSGFFISPNLIPVWLRWARYLCSLSYAFNLVLLGEFSNCPSESCIVLLQNFSIDESHEWMYWLILLAIFLGFRLLAMAFLKKKATKFY